MSSITLVQLLGGLSYATTLFLMAAGLTLIFGVTRIVNFAHGSFFMLGALFSAHWLVHWYPHWAESAWLYLLAMLVGAAVAACAGALADVLLLRRMAAAPELYQLVATFGLTLAMHDAMRWGFGNEEVFAPRFPALKGSVEIGGELFPSYQLALMLVGPLVWLGLHLMLTRTLFGQRLRAATEDREILGALGVNPRPLMLAAVVIGCGLAGLGGALQLPREPAHLQMDTAIIVETFVVVVTGGLGSIGGAFAAALLIGLVHALSIQIFPQATLVLVFLTMAVVLVLRPQGLAPGRLAAVHTVREPAQVFGGMQLGRAARTGLALALVSACGAAWWGGPYWQTLALDTLVFVLFGISLQAMMGLAGLVSFGHAAYFAVGAYAAAWSHLHAGAALGTALLMGVLSAVALAALFGAAVVRSSGVYLAMLSLALAQVVWATATQAVAWTGGDNGLIGLRLVSDGMRPYFYAAVVAIVLLALAGLRRLALSGQGAALQALRDAPMRAHASALPVAALKYRVFLYSAALAGLAGALFAAHKGTVFPSAASVATSVDALLVVLLGGVHQLWGAVAGSTLLHLASALLGRDLPYWRGFLGVVIMLVMLLSPSGVLSALGPAWARLMAGLRGRRRS